MRAIVPLLLATALRAADATPAPHPLDATVGVPFAHRARFSGANLAYASDDLPAGIALDAATGELRGVPTAAGEHVFTVTARNRGGAARIAYVLRVAAGAAPAPQRAPPPPPPPADDPPPPPRTGAPPPPPPPAGRDEEDEADPMLASGAPLAPWTDNQRRVIHHWFLPGAAGLPAGDWYYRISHVARDACYAEPRTNLFGLDDNVKIGITVGYALAKGVTATLTRVNGRDLAVAPVGGDPVQYDTWELLGRFQVLDQRGVRGWWQGPCDLSVIAGGSWLLRNHGTGDVSLDAGVVAERDLFHDRLRLGVGIVRAGLSSYEAAIGDATIPDKRFPDELDYLASQGLPVEATASSTTAVPITARLALSQHWFALGETVIPIAGWRTGHGPAEAVGIGLDTNTHEYTFMVANTANAAFNSVITGGTGKTSLPFFGFTITAYF